MTEIPDYFDERVAELEAEINAALIRAYDATAALIDIDALADAIATGDDTIIAEALKLDEGVQTDLHAELSNAFFMILLGGIILAMKGFASRYRSRIDTASHVQRLREELQRNVIRPLGYKARDAALTTIKIMQRHGYESREIALAARRNLALSPDQAKSAVHFKRALDDALNDPTAIRTREGVTLPAKTQNVIRRRHAKSLNAAQRSVLAKALATELTAKGIARLVDRHARALADYRHRVIAHQEANRSIHAGEYLAFRQGKANRSLPREAKRFWRTVGDERVRHSHSAVPGMNASGVDVGEPFQTPLGPVLYPPLEVNCRCRVIVRTQE